MKQLLSIFLIVILGACQTKKGKIIFYIENGSEVDSLINIKVFISESIRIDTVFKYSTITPNYDTFVVEEPINDSILISASTNTGANRQFKIKFNKDAYVFLTYVHDSVTTEKQRKAIKKMMKDHNGNDPSLLLEKKAIREKVEYTEPILY